MAKQHLTWVEHIRLLQQSLESSSSRFVLQFSERLRQAVDNFLKGQSGLPLSSHQETASQKGLVHAFQLYDEASLLKVIANYDVSQDMRSVGMSIIKKSLHSLQVIPNLETRTTVALEKDLLLSYKKKLTQYVSYALSCPIEEVGQPEGLKHYLLVFSKRQLFGKNHQEQFFKKRLDLLFSPEYRVYLILRNQFFLNHLLQEVEKYQLEAWFSKILNQIQVPSRPQLRSRLDIVNFRTMEYLVQCVSQYIAQKNTQSEAQKDESLLMDSVSEESNSVFSKIKEGLTPTMVQLLRELERVPIAPPLAQDSQETPTEVSAKAPTVPLERSPFEQLCFRYLKELMYLANHTELVQECSAPYFFPKIEEYTFDKSLFFHQFFSSENHIAEEFTQFVEELLEKTADQNRFAKQKEEIGVYGWVDGGWQMLDTQEREREWTVLLKSRLPFSMSLPSDNPLSGGGPEETLIEKGRSFILQWGITYFDYDHPKQKRISTQPTGYFKVLIRGTQLVSHSAIIYFGNSPFYRLTEYQLMGWKGLILLYLIVMRNKFSMDLSPALQDYLVKTIPPNLPKL